MARYGSSFRRSSIRTLVWSSDSAAVGTVTVREHDPVMVCARRPKGQITCGEINCEQCPTDTLNLTSLGNHLTVGVIGEGITHNLIMHDRHATLNRQHGMVRPSEVDWEEMQKYPTGNNLPYLTQIFQAQNSLWALFKTFLPKFQHFISVLDWRGQPLIFRINVGQHWGKNLVGRQQVQKGYKPQRRYFQVK